MSRNSLSEMGIDLTNELALLMRLSFSDKWFIGKGFIDDFSNSIISNDIPKIKALAQAYYNIDMAQSDSCLSMYKKNVLPVFDSINKKLYSICSLSNLIEQLEIEYENNGWGDIFIKGFKELQSNGIEYINPYDHPYKYADIGMPYIEYWCNEELLKNNCPFTSENAIDYFFDFVERVRQIQKAASRSAVLRIDPVPVS